MLFIWFLSLSRALVCRCLLGDVTRNSILACLGRLFLQSSHCGITWYPGKSRQWHQKAFPSLCTPLIFSSKWGILHPFQGRKLQWPLSLESIRLPLNSHFLPSGLPSFGSLLLTEHFRFCPYLEISNFSHVILQSGQYFHFPLNFLLFPWFSPPPSGTPHTTLPLILRWFYIICSRVLCMELGCVCCV